MKNGVLYIAGYGRSGSSVLSRMLGCAPGLISIGEFWRIRGEIEKDRLCSCGSRIVDCEFWSGALFDQDGVTMKTEIEIIRTLANGPGVICVIDSTKTAYTSCVKPLVYLKNDFEIGILHLTRSLDAVVESARKGRNRDLEEGVKRVRKFEYLRTAIGWLFANAAARTYGLFYPDRYLCVQYEDLIERPDEVLRDIGDFLHVDLGDVGAYFEAGNSFCSGHEIAGNRTLRSGGGVLRRSRRSQ